MSENRARSDPQCRRGRPKASKENGVASALIVKSMSWLWIVSAAATYAVIYIIHALSILKIGWCKWFHWKFFGYKSSGNGGTRDPFEVLGLEGGSDGITIEAATKARRKLALKWHPDRNIDNTEEATKKMQEINYAYTEVERILSSENKTGDIGSGDETESESECENAQDRRHQRRQKKRKAPRQEKRYDEKAESERKMRDEMNRFNRAYRSAQKGSFGSSTTNKENDAPRQKGVQGKGRSKTARKRAKNKRKKEERKFVENLNSNPPSPTKDYLDGKPTAQNIPFHRLSPEKRCEIKFGSAMLIKSPIFTAIRAHTFNLLRIMGMMIRNAHIYSPIPALETSVIVTPLMVACYLGDAKAVNVIIALSKKRWAEAVLVTTRQGDDCLDLAVESRDIAEKLYEESKEQLDEIATKKDQARQEKNIEQCKENLEMATNLVEHIRSLKNFALKKKKEIHFRRNIIILIVIGIASFLSYYYHHKLGNGNKSR